MYKVEYDTVAIMPDGSKGNISQGKRVAYMQCSLSSMSDILKAHLVEGKKPLFPKVIKIDSIEGEIIK